MSGIGTDQLEAAEAAYIDGDYYRYQIQTAVDLALEAGELTEAEVIDAVFEAFKTRRLIGKGTQ